MQVQADVQCGARRQEYCQFVAFKRPDGKLVVIMTNDEITVGPIAGTGVGIAVTPWLAKGQGSLTLGSKTLSWKVTCGSKTVSGTLPWKSIQTVVCYFIFLCFVCVCVCVCVFELSIIQI